MQRRQLNALCRSTCEYFCSRNNDVNGYWGIGVLCQLALLKGRRKIGFRTTPGDAIQVFGCELSHSQPYSDVLRSFGVDCLEGRISFFDDGRFHNGKDRFTCGICLAMTGGGKFGLHMVHVSCWPHDPLLERRRSDDYRPLNPTRAHLGVMPNLRMHRSADSRVIGPP